ncbi:hypothetical protein [Salinarimonas soli]|uniref:Uncharacterized protein n=1 Tax=Salinarimonas soli TaxID=1638099 RepID=A0A5B2VHI2_9HYPH|nr:hypothetical protein [Salinarimonas soli]KAA2238364.1 hypothetical protein F0L46_05500 [Salinarimonas soli]
MTLRHAPLSPGEDHDALTGEVQTALAVLADIETRFAIDRERLDRWAGPDAVKAHLVSDLHRRREAERGPVMRRLSDLQASLRRAMSARSPLSIH